MARFCGTVGFVRDFETAPDIWKGDTAERTYYGDVLRASHRWEGGGDKLNDDLNVSNRISIVADSFAIENVYCMKYVVFMGQKWKISEVETEYPRLILTIGGLYNG